MLSFRIIVLTAVLLGLMGCIAASEIIKLSPSSTTDLDEHFDQLKANRWYSESSERLKAAVRVVARQTNQPRLAKNIILFIGDGMSIATVTAARILEGQNRGLSGEENFLSFGQFPFLGLVKTYNVDAQTPDSAGTMTAIMSGIKTDFGVVGVDEKVTRGDCESQSGNEVISALELAEIAGLSTGIVSTARITHATPAAAYAHSVEREWEDISSMPDEAIKAGCEDIASQLINFEANLESKFASVDIDGLEVVLGGGAQHFLPISAAHESGFQGIRSDQRNLINEWTQSHLPRTFVKDNAELEAVDSKLGQKVLGLFSGSHMLFESVRTKSKSDQPSLSDMTKRAIELTENNPKGFFLVIESGRIDHAHHLNNAFNALSETIELSSAVQTALDATNAEETLIIVTSDHGHVMTISGYPRRGNPILGKVVSLGESAFAQDLAGLPYTTLGYQNGPGLGLGLGLGRGGLNPDLAYQRPPAFGRHDLTKTDTLQSGFRQESLVPLYAETHSGEDVVVYASGPGAHLATGTMEQSVIFHIMDYAVSLKKRAKAAIANVR